MQTDQNVQNRGGFITKGMKQGMKNGFWGTESNQKADKN